MDDSHDLVTMELGPQINFIVGHNGSGKSAILAGITMALGGNARATVSRVSYRREGGADDRRRIVLRVEKGSSRMIESKFSRSFRSTRR